MASLDFFNPSSAPYPGADTSQSGNGSATGAPVPASSSGDSWLNRLFAPKYVDYPMPLTVNLVDRKYDEERWKAMPAPTAPPASIAPAPAAWPVTPAPVAPAPIAPAPIAPASINPAPIAPAPVVPASVASVATAGLPSSGASSPSPVTVVIAPWGAAGANGTAPIAASGTPSTGGNGASAAPIATPIMAPSATPSSGATCMPTRAQAKILRAFVFNPLFEQRARTAQEEYLEEEIGEAVDEEFDARMVLRDATPVAFVVPEGCNAVDLLYGPIEATPGCGCDADLEQIVTVGQAKLSANVCGIDGPLTPGDQLMITVPWRSASWVDLPSGRLRLPLLLHFYNSNAE